MTLRAPAPSSDPPHPWLASYPLNIDWAAPLPVRTMTEVFAEAVAKWADRACLDFMGRQWTYAAVDRLAARCARGLQDRGVVKGDRIGICMPNVPDFVVAYLAALRTGAVAVPLNPLLPEGELARQIDNCGIRLLVTSNVKEILPGIIRVAGRTALEAVFVSDLAGALPPAKKVALKAVNAVQSLFGRAPLVKTPRDGKYAPFSVLLSSDAPPDPVEILPPDLAMLVHTFGTTGAPKCAMWTQAALVANCVQETLWWEADHMSSDVPSCIVVMPLFSAIVLAGLMNPTFNVGGRAILVPVFDPAALLKLIHRERPHVLFGVPEIYRLLVEHPDIGKYNLSCLELCTNGLLPLAAPVNAAWKEKTGVEIVEGYSSGEGSLVTGNPVHGVKKINSVGIPMPRTEVKIVDLKDPRRAVVPGEWGEVCSRGPQNMAGYWKDPERTAKAIDSDGFVHTGDIGWMDGDGYLFLVDRREEMLTDAQGRHVFPRRAVNALLLHPAVAEAVAAGVKDAEGKTVLKAWVVTKKEQYAFPDDLKAFIRDRLAPHEVPSEIGFRDFLPKTVIGAPDKARLRAEDAAGRRA